MIDPEVFWDGFKSCGIDFATGVPDSLLKDFCAFLDKSLPKNKHIISANEGAAIALAAGHYLSTKIPALVYMQNSGLGNAINPLLSLADEEVYSIPMILVIGWRGENGVKDEPQHKKQGEVTTSILEAMKVKYRIIDKNDSDPLEICRNAFYESTKNNAPFVLLVRKGTFEKKSKLEEEIKFKNNLLNREDTIKTIIENIPKNTIVVSTTGHISRELYEIRKRSNDPDGIDFLTVGSMGHSSQIALGIAINKPDFKVLCIDGDGALIMHMGSMAINGSLKLNNFRHILLNNGVHGSVGGQPTVGFETNFVNIAASCNYENIFGPIKSLDNLESNIKIFNKINGPNFMEIHVDKKAREDLGRPKESPIENKLQFMEKIF